MSTLVSKRYTRFDTIGYIVVVRISGLILKIHRIQRKDLLVLDISLCWNVNTSTGQRQISKSIRRSRNFHSRIESEIIIWNPIIF